MISHIVNFNLPADEDAFDQFLLELENAVSECADCQVSEEEIHILNDADELVGIEQIKDVTLCQAHQYAVDGELVTAYSTETEEMFSEGELWEARIVKLEEDLFMAHLAREQLIKDFIRQVGTLTDGIAEMQAKLSELNNADNEDDEQ